MRKSLTPILIFAMNAVNGCGDSLGTLNSLAAAGSIHEDAPVTARLRIHIAAPPSKVWALLVDAPSWPRWQTSIDSVTASGPLMSGRDFSWRTGGTNIHSQVQLCEPERHLAWTGTALTAKAVHVWELQPEPENQTLLTMKESMDGPWMARMYPSPKLVAADTAWLEALKREAERKP